MIRRSDIIGRCSLFALLPCLSAVAAGPVETVFSDIQGHPTAAVPGAPSLAFRRNDSGRFGQLAASPSGRWWAVVAPVVDESSTPGTAILVSTGTEAHVAVRTGIPAPAGQGVFSGFAPEVSVSDTGVITFEAAVIAGGVEVSRLYRGRIAAGNMPVLAPLDQDAGPSAEPTVGVASPPPAPPIALVEPADDAVPFTVAALNVTPGGDWLARGTDEAGREWVFRNGEPVALAGAPVTLNPDEPERFIMSRGLPAFFSMQTNRAGDIVIGGVIDAGAASGESGGGQGTEHAAAVILNNQRVILRQGDAIDLDADGVDDDAFIHSFSADGAILTDTGFYYFNAEIRDAAGAILGRALLRARICKPDWDASGDPNSSDIADFLSGWMVSVTQGCGLADYNRDGQANSADITTFLSDWMSAVTGGC